MYIWISYMAVKLTDKQLELLIHALENRVTELNQIINPLLEELADHRQFLEQYQLTSAARHNDQVFELLPWSKRIVQILQNAGHPMTAHEITAEVIRRIPVLAGEPSTRSSVASILSRRCGKLFRKTGDTYGLIEWEL